MPAPPNTSLDRSLTSPSLLERAKAQDQDAWGRLVKLYAPLVYRECRSMGVPQQDGPDVVQDVYRKVAANLAGFRHDRPGDSFRAWLATIARNSIRDYFRMQARRPVAIGGSGMLRRVQDLPDIDTCESTISGRPDANARVVQQAIAYIRNEFENHTWDAFWKTTVERVGPPKPAGYRARLTVRCWAVGTTLGVVA